MRRFVWAVVLCFLYEQVPEGIAVFLSSVEVPLDRCVVMRVHFEAKVIGVEWLFPDSQQVAEGFLAFCKLGLELVASYVGDLAEHLVLLFQSVAVHLQIPRVLLEDMLELVFGQLGDDAFDSFLDVACHNVDLLEVVVVRSALDESQLHKSSSFFFQLSDMLVTDVVHVADHSIVELLQLPDLQIVMGLHLEQGFVVLAHTPVHDL